jgi:hypothetical protein
MQGDSNHRVIVSRTDSRTSPLSPYSSKGVRPISHAKCLISKHTCEGKPRGKRQVALKLHDISSHLHPSRYYFNILVFIQYISA